jgi:flagellar biosynthesis/type III secretory pathway protein FliH
MGTKVLKYVHFEPENKVAISPRSKQKNKTGSINNTESPAQTSNGVHQTQTANEEAAVILANAQKKADEILQQAQAQITAWQNDAYQQGREAGYAEGQQVAQEENQQILTTAQQLLTTAETVKDEFIVGIQDSIGELAVTIAEKIIGKEITQNQQAVTNIVGKVLEAANVHGACTIRVNPLDYEILGPLWETIPSMQSPTQKWELVPDKRIEQGGCMIEVNGGIIDAQLGTQLMQVRKSFKSVDSRQVAS